MEAAKGCIEVHEGQNIRKLRSILDVPQKELADRMGTSQQRVSKIENMPVLDDETREKVADALGIPSALISNYDQQSVINIISDNTFSGEGSGSQMASTSGTHNQTTYPIELLIEMFGKALREESSKTDALLRLLEAEKECSRALEQKIEELSQQLQKLSEI